MSVKEISMKVVADAREQVELIERNTEKAAALTIERAQTEAGALNDDAIIIGDRDAERERRRAGSRGELAARDALISAKRELIAEVFTQARTALDEMSDENYINLLSRLIERHARGGEQIIFDTAIPDTLPDRIVNDANLLLRPGDRQPVRVAPFVRDVGRGFVIDSSHVEEDLSFDSLVKMASEELEADVSRILFCD